MCGENLDVDCPACGEFVRMRYDDDAETFECPECSKQFKDKDTPIEGGG